jgi:hypothetical protein
MEAAGPSETLIPIYTNTRHHIPRGTSYEVKTVVCTSVNAVWQMTEPFYFDMRKSAKRLGSSLIELPSFTAVTNQY